MAHTALPCTALQDRAQRISRDQGPFPDHVYHVDPSEGEEGEFTSKEEDPDLHQGDPNLTQLIMTEEEQRDYDFFSSGLGRGSSSSSR